MGVGGHKRLLVMLGFVLCLCGFARPALAAPKVGKVVNGSGDAATVDVQVIGSGISNGFSAAAWSFGVDPASLTGEQKAKLSNESTGGAFYRYAMAFQSGAHEPITVGLSSWYAVTLPQFVWTLEGYPYGDYAQARRDLKTIRDGGSLGGGGGSGGEVVGDVVYLTFTGTHRFVKNTSTNPTVSYLNDVYQHSFQGAANSASGSMPLYCADFFTKYTGDNYVTQLPSLTLRVFVPKTFYDSFPPDDWDYYLRIYQASSATTLPVYVVRTFRAGTAVESTGTNAFQDVALSDGSTFTNTDSYINRVSSNSNSGGLAMIKRTADMSVSVSGSVSGFSYVYVSGDLSAGFDIDSSTSASFSDSEGIFKLGAVGGGGGGDNNWPTDDPTPTPDPPEVPGPSDNPVVSPEPPDLPNPVDYPVSDPYTPDPDPPTNPIITYDPDPTGDALDYRPWLNAILKLLRTINTTIDDGFYDVDVWLTEHCDHIREMMHDEALTLGLKMQAAINNGFVSFERWLQSTYGPYFFEELDARLRAILADYEDYLYGLFVWLSEQFDFSVSGGSGSYDDSTLLYWLQQIWAILAEKPSVGTEPDSFFDWLANLLAGILGGLVAWLLGALGGMADAVSGLATKFPFSLPWDIATMLALFVHEPVTPVFDLPFALPGEYANVRVDMSYFDEVMAAVRGVELVLFGLALAKRTPEMLELADTVFS